MPKKQMKEKLNEEREKLKLKRRAKREELRERGITLIALVVTIIILLILAGVTLNIALSDGGLFSKTKKAADDYKQAQTNEEGIITDIEKELDKYGSGNPLPSNPTPSEGTPTPIPIADVKKGDKFEETTTVTDGNGNKVVIPGEFKIAEASGDTVQEGIVIEDDEGNQFVWIPVSNVDGGKDPDSSDGEDNLIKVDNDKTVEITLGRYTFDTGNGTPTLKQNGDNQEKDILIENHYNESIVTNRKNGGVGAKDLAKFIQSVKANHGYYIARYEAGNDGSNKPISKSGAVWNNVTQLQSSTAAQGMYGVEDEEAKYVESDLVNSYAWDTAIVYIQEMKENNKNYANAKSTISSLTDTGVTEDEKCHIFDMAGNVSEWTTEYSTPTGESDNYTCVARGGSFYGKDYCTSDRVSTHPETGIGNHVGFRPLLYLKQS